MAIFRIEKTKDYTVMSNHHLRDRELSLKGKGLLSLMLSLPENWDYTLKGLAVICKDGIDSVRKGVSELEHSGYLSRRRLREPNGRLGDIEYTILEVPLKNADSTAAHAKKTEPTCDAPASGNPTSGLPMSGLPTSENPIQANPTYENPTQLNTNESNIQISNTHISNIHQSIRADAPETMHLQEQCGIDAMDAIEIYRDIIKENIDYGNLRSIYEYSVDEINEILELMLETVCSKRDTIRIGGEDKPAELVKSRMLKLDSSHIEYVMDCMSKNTTEVRNIRGYLLTTLFNAPATIGNYYKARVNHDFNGQ
jgi:hypothetical protein